MAHFEVEGGRNFGSGYVSPRVVCGAVDVCGEMSSSQSYCDGFLQWSAFLIKRRSKFVVFHPNFEPPPFYTTIYRKKIRMPGTQGKKGGRNFRGPGLAGHPVKLAGKKQNIDPMWKVRMKEVDLGEPKSFLHHVYLGCTHRECETSKDIVDNNNHMFESGIPAGAKEKLPCSGKPDADISSCMEGHAKKFVERYCELANKTIQQLYKVATPCLDDHQFKEEELGSVGELSTVCSQNVLTCLYLARTGRPDIQWSLNKLVRAVTTWTKACDKRVTRLISYIRHTSEFKQYCHVGNTA